MDKEDKPKDEAKPTKDVVLFEDATETEDSKDTIEDDPIMEGMGLLSKQLPLIQIMWWVNNTYSLLKNNLVSFKYLWKSFKIS